jgi:hypothetical protein
MLQIVKSEPCLSSFLVGRKHTKERPKPMLRHPRDLHLLAASGSRRRRGEDGTPLSLLFKRRFRRVQCAAAVLARRREGSAVDWLLMWRCKCSKAVQCSNAAVSEDPSRVAASTPSCCSHMLERPDRLLSNIRRGTATYRSAREPSGDPGRLLNLLS